MKEEIIKIIKNIAEDYGWEIKTTLNEESLLIECGLDSLGFAILVAQLEETYKYDPFSMMEEPLYPETLGEFVAIYEKYRS